MSKQKLHNIKDNNEDTISLTPEEYMALKEKTEDTFINFQRLLNRNNDPQSNAPKYRIRIK